MKVKDHFLSGESFELVYNNHYGYYKTSPEMGLSDLSYYYNTQNYISHQEKANDVKSLIYNLVKKYMFRQKYAWINKFVNYGSWLDFGAGTGEFLDFLPKQDWEKIAFEPNKKAAKKIKSKGIATLNDYDNIESKVDVISAFHAIEHVVDITKWFEFVINISKKDTVVAIAVPNYNSFDAFYYQGYWAAYDVPRHQYHFSKKSIYQLFSENGFELIREKPLLFDSYYVSLLSEKYKKKNNLINALRVGFLSNLKAEKSKEYSSSLFIFRKLDE